MALCDARTVDAIITLAVAGHAMVVGIGTQRVPTAPHKIKGPVPVLIGQLAIAPSVTDFGQQFVLDESRAQGDSD